jgi:disulfide oxidoreductase YuzD
MTPKFFPTQADFRRWLEANHDKETEIIVGYYNVGSGKSGMTWLQTLPKSGYEKIPSYGQYLNVENNICMKKLIR